MDKHSCPYGDKDESAQLCEDWRAATAAEEAAEIAATANNIELFGALLTFISVGLLIWTLLLTRKQLRIADAERIEARAEAADLARDTASALAQATRNADTAFAALALERPWVTFEKARSALAGNPTIEDREWPYGMAVNLILQNRGRTPAFDVIIATGVEMVPYADVLTFSDMGEPKGEREGAGQIAAPQQDILVPPVGFGFDDPASPLKDGHEFIIRVTVEYRVQPKGEKCVTEAIIGIRVNGAQRNSAGGVEPHFDVRQRLIRAT
tara:strand:- start:4128 stop:4931 length:804 start_codon:yes stop_codon:yes gene_type:complete